MGALVDGEQRCGHRDIDVLASSGLLTTVKRRQDRDNSLQASIDVGVRQAVRARFSKRITIVTNAVFGEAGLGLYGRRVSHPAAPWSSLARR